MKPASSPPCSDVDAWSITWSEGRMTLWSDELGERTFWNARCEHVSQILSWLFERRGQVTTPSPSRPMRR